ncbi:molybdopterin-guanine dinucleotide biosynthesis protein [Nocardiopsis sp. HNM0947]|uniref:Molybdopterin-guanine dinucleotide biosynthesis protein n=1 Tax=Nocardiopsis coralli TaxID=2772213 RepID=A0ABR9PBU2_9ACTN|nr:DUF6457 domain-containing protein [Nocardiopsis coralli]MBE3001313.1 molybdopterin-guanine dinucleotide biosynthesis protein [Nocardiopsis coralli]
MTLVEWADLVRAELELDENERLDRADVDRVLDLAKDAAHSVARPAAPLTTFLMGVAVGRGADPQEVAARLSRLALDSAGE